VETEERISKTAGSGPGAGKVAVADFDEEKELGRLYTELLPGPDDQLRSFPPQKEGLTNVEPEQQARVDQALSNADLSDETSGAHQSDERLKQRQRELDGHDRLMARGAAMAARDLLRDSGPGKEPGAYTVYEARDRAGHTPAALAREPEK
jgi:hypothetical protein